MGRGIVVAFRMSDVGMAPGPEGSYLTRARALCVRGEALGGRLVAWSGSHVAMAWDFDSVEKVVVFAASIREEALSAERAWASGIAEGNLEWLSPDGQGILAWGPGLLSAVFLARLASAGEVLVDADVRALRAGQLMLRDARAAPEAGEAVRGWRLDLEHPWKRAHADDLPSMPEVDANTAASTPQSIPVERPYDPSLVTRIRKLASDSAGGAAVDRLAELRRARARAEQGSSSARCQASLGLAMMLSIAGRLDEALLDALDALARAREAPDPKAIGACMALLSKLYAGAGLSDAATALRESVTPGY
ncbi:MAG: hypothetical protein M3O46_06565 [Myxococcota bacterium]|nr:hypothetical protein [Myxococcota bacterium]